MTGTRGTNEAPAPVARGARLRRSTVAISGRATALPHVRQSLSGSRVVSVAFPALASELSATDLRTGHSTRRTVARPPDARMLTGGGRDATTSLRLTRRP